jgi:hypothetical protein
MMDNNPVYEYLGYHLLSADIKREKFLRPKEISIQIGKIKLKDSNFSFEISLNGVETEKQFFSFVFLTRFRILNAEWLKAVNGNENLASILFPVAFPFIRQSIFASTNDSLGPIFIPIIDLRGIKITDGLKLIRKEKEEVK